MMKIKRRTLNRTRRTKYAAAKATRGHSCMVTAIMATPVMPALYYYSGTSPGHTESRHCSYSG